MNYLRQLCEELHNALAEYDSADAYRDHSGLLRRARATLAGNPDAALLPPNHNEDEIKRWLLNEYPLSPDWMAYANSPGEEFEGYHLDSVPHIILQALARFGGSNPLPADCIDPEHIGADRELLRDADLVLSTAASMLELAAPIPQPIPVTERLPGPEDCCGNPRNGQGQWCWGRVRPRTTAGTPVVWRLMRIDCLIEEAEDWLPWWAIPLPAADAGEVQGNG